jgi:thioredoxin 1
MATKTITDSSFQADVLSAEGPVLVDFWAEWCGPCKMIGPALEELSEELAGKVTIAKLNIDDNPEIAAKMGIRSIPALMMFKGGQKVDDILGARPKSQLKAFIENSL